MPASHPRPYHAGSLFGPGPRRPLDREQRARFRFLLTAHRRGRRLTPLTEMVGNALVRRLSVNGQCDPSHETIATDVGCCSRTVRRALDALKALGVVMWQRRLVRDGWRVEQTSNAYLLAPLEVTNPAVIWRGPTAGQNVRQTRLESSLLPPASPQDVADARTALARRCAAVSERLLNKGVEAMACPR